MKLVQQNHSTIYKSRSLSACFTRVPLVHSLMLSGSKKHIGALSLSSRLVTNPAGQPRPGQGCRCIVHAVVGDEGGDQRLPAHPDRRPCHSLQESAGLGGASGPFLLPVVLWPRCSLPTPSLAHAGDPHVYIPSKAALLYCPSSSPFMWILFYFRPLLQSHLDFYYY